MGDSETFNRRLMHSADLRFIVERDDLESWDDKKIQGLLGDREKFELELQNGFGGAIGDLIQIDGNKLFPVTPSSPIVDKKRKELCVLTQHNLKQQLNHIYTDLEDDEASSKDIYKQVRGLVKNTRTFYDHLEKLIPPQVRHAYLYPRITKALESMIKAEQHPNDPIDPKHPNVTLKDITKEKKLLMDAYDRLLLETSAPPELAGDM